MPDFLIARQSFDCAITGYAIKKEHVLEVDLTQAVFAIHQNHHYGDKDEFGSREQYEDHVATEVQSNKGYCHGEWGMGHIDGCGNYVERSKASPRFVFKKK